MKEILQILGLGLLMMACQNQMGLEDNMAPQISIMEPQTFEFQAGDTMKIKVRIEDNDQLHDWYLGLNNLSQMRKEIHWSQHYHGQAIQLDTLYILDSNSGSSHYELQLEASDHLDNTREIRIPIFVLSKN